MTHLISTVYTLEIPCYALHRSPETQGGHLQPSLGWWFDPHEGPEPSPLTHRHRGGIIRWKYVSSIPPQGIIDVYFDLASSRPCDYPALAQSLIRITDLRNLVSIRGSLDHIGPEACTLNHCAN